jgi:uncharacterized protein (TIGR00255 family)
MIKSMTGYGRGEFADGTRTATCEIRSVNHRYCEVTVKMPSKYGFAEEAVRQAVKAAAGRGKVDVSIALVSTADEDTGVILGEAVAKQYIDHLRTLQEKYGVGGEITVGLLAGLPDVLKQGHPDLDADAISGVILSAVTRALEGFDGMREREGASLAANIGGKLDAVDALCQKIGARAPEVQTIYADKLRERIAALAGLPGDDAVLQQRIAVEIATFADKAGIDEELVRLASHVSQFRDILAAPETVPVGKKLDFIVQEMNREANTIGSKANDLQITDRMIELKNEIENIREQIQNIC